MLATLDLDPHDGDLDFIEAIERSFRIRLSQADVGAWKTLGDVHETLKALVQPGAITGPCPTVIAFHGLRRALTDIGHARTDATPSARLADFADGKPAALFRRLHRQTALDLPHAPYRQPGKIGSWLVLVGLVLMIVLLLHGLWRAAGLSGLFMFAGGMLARFDAGTLPAGIVTLGDLAEQAAALNRTALQEQGAREMPNGLWSTLVAISAELAEVDPNRLGQDTFLFRHVCKQDADNREPA